MPVIEHVIGRVRLDLPVASDLPAAQHDLDVQLVALDVLANLFGRLPVERNSDDLEIRRGEVILGWSPTFDTVVGTENAPASIGAQSSASRTLSLSSLNPAAISAVDGSAG